MIYESHLISKSTFIEKYVHLRTVSLECSCFTHEYCALPTNNSMSASSFSSEVLGIIWCLVNYN